MTLALVSLSVVARAGHRCSRRRSCVCTWWRPTRPTARRRSSSGSSSCDGSCRRSSSTASARSPIGLLNAHRRFAAPMFAPILNNLVVIATFLAYAMLRGDRPPAVDGITDAEKTVLGAGTTLGVVAMTLALWPSLRSHRLSGGGSRFDWRHEARPAPRSARGVGGRLRRRQPARLPGHHRAQRPVRRPGAYRSTRRRSSSSRSPTRSSRSRSSRRCCPAWRSGGRPGIPTGVRELFSRGLRDTAVVIDAGGARRSSCSPADRRAPAEHGAGGRTPTPR